MDYIIPIERHQIAFGSPGEMVTADHPVRFPDAFAGKSDLERMGFQLTETALEGRPCSILSLECSSSKASSPFLG